MVLDDHLAEVLDVFVLRLLLTELTQRDLFVVVDDQQRQNARLKLLRLSARQPRSAELSGLPRLNTLPRLRALSWLRSRLIGTRLGRLRRFLGEQQRGTAKEHHQRAGGATK
jgi:hypothetical protein